MRFVIAVQQVLGPCSVKLSTGRPDGVDNKSVAASTTTTTNTTSVSDRQPLQLPLALLRVTTSRTGACLGRTAAASSTPRGRVLELLAGRCHERPDSALSNFSELDSGYDELRSFTMTPVIPPELVITGPQDTRLDLLPSSSVGSKPEEGDKNGKEDDENDYEHNKSVSEESDSCRSEALPEDRFNASSMIEQDDLLSANTGTGNSSAVSLSSLDAVEGCRLSADNSESERDIFVYSMQFLSTCHFLIKIYFSSTRSFL